MKYLEELKCDTCDRLIGYVEENDLNGSYFYCDLCAGNADKKIDESISHSQRETE